VTRRRRLLYILAPSFSGSTLLTYLLAQHDDVSTIGELKATKMGDVNQYRCSCGSLIRECGFWNAVEARARATGLPFSVENFGTVFRGDNPLASKVVQAAVRPPALELVRRVALATVPGAGSAVRRIAAHNLALANIVCELQGGAIFLDGSKDSVRLLHLLASDLWQVQVIYLQRDGRGVAHSIRSHRGVSYAQALEIWRENVVELERMRRRLDGVPVFDLHYEELCGSPIETLERIWEWLGVTPMPVRQNFRDGEYHILGNAMRLSNANEVRLDERWKSAVTAEELAAFERRNGALNRELGYE
jgi:hypothetical protein